MKTEKHKMENRSQHAANQMMWAKNEVKKEQQAKNETDLLRKTNRKNRNSK